MEADTLGPADMIIESATKLERLPITISKPIPYTFDLGNLLCNDTNPLPPSPSDSQICSAARDCAQALINQLLTTCPITSHPSNGVLLTLPSSTTILPREKPLPAERQQTKWEKFAKKKGIKDKKRGEGKMVYEEETGEWVPKWGYKGRNKDGEGDWIVEVDEKKEIEVQGKGDGSTLQGEGRRERVDKVRRNDRKQRANERKERKAGTIN
ncbi:Rhodanese- sulfurtransferase [Ptychographa xylographoides]|nr:Rhodanese- sulfurtransferase [Ptychographa xylographoides]